jgi:hypothetical protein
VRTLDQHVSFSQGTQQNVNQSIVQDLNDEDEPVNVMIHNARSYGTRSRSQPSPISTVAPLRVSSKFFLLQSLNHPKSRSFFFVSIIFLGINDMSPPRTSVPQTNIPATNYRRNLGG